MFLGRRCRHEFYYVCLLDNNMNRKYEKSMVCQQPTEIRSRNGLSILVKFTTDLWYLDWSSLGVNTAWAFCRHNDLDCEVLPWEQRKDLSTDEYNPCLDGTSWEAIALISTWFRTRPKCEPYHPDGDRLLSVGWLKITNDSELSSSSRFSFAHLSPD